MSDSDDEDTFVTIGTPLEVLEDGEPAKKPVFVQDMQAKDSKGRSRFHGAFTGGFSAGYFNSVGSKEGFVPATFVSSREKRHEAAETYKPEDFMDDEDVGEYGIAPRKFVAGAQFSSEERKRRREQEAALATSDSLLQGDSKLLDIIVPGRITVGVKLLRKMGWKEGQGVGPRQTKKQKQKAGRKMYGCAGPPSSESDMDDDKILSDITFAPADTAQISLGSKDNTHGLGYRGLDPRKALPSTHVNLFDAPRVKKSARSRKGIRGQGFGVGALEDDDDDIYAMDDMSNYDQSMTMEQDDKFGWTGPSHKGKPQETPVGYVGKLLDGFSLSKQKLEHKPVPSLVTIPRDYRPVHRFKKAQEDPGSLSISQSGVGVDYRQFLRPDDSTVTHVAAAGGPDTPGTSTDTGPQRLTKHDAASRSLALGEKAFVGSVFDLIPAQDRNRLNKAGQGVNGSQEPMNTEETTPVEVKVEAAEPIPSAPSVSSSEQAPDKTPLFKASGAFGAMFKPFSKDPSKQERYEKYLQLVKQGHKDAYSVIASQGGPQTEWAVERERVEFSKAATLYRPLQGMMAMRFTSGGVTDDILGTETKTQETAVENESMKAARMKMYGKLTRETYEWHPDKLVCKRFNVPNPYPGSSVVGLETVKRDKYSVFNFLNFSNPMETYQRQDNVPALSLTASSSETNIDNPELGRPESSQSVSSIQLPIGDQPNSLHSATDPSTGIPGFAREPTSSVDRGQHRGHDVMKAIEQSSAIPVDKEDVMSAGEKLSSSKADKVKDMRKSREKSSPSPGPTSRVEKELNKGKEMKSIFSHLMNTENTVQKSTKVSFSLKSNKLKPYKSIFSHLEHESATAKSAAANKSTAAATNSVGTAAKTSESDGVVTGANETAKTVTQQNISSNAAGAADNEKMEVETTEQKTSKKDKTVEATGMDLFRAIFRNTDSEESSSSEDEATLTTTVPSSSNNIVANVTKDSTESVNVAVPKDSTESENATVTKDSSTSLLPVPDKPSNQSQQQNSLGSNIQDNEKASVLPGNSRQIGSLESRLSPGRSDDGADSYGPALPPPLHTEPVLGASAGTVSRPHEDQTPDSSRKHKHKHHKDKHKHKKEKKEKKEKHKKSKHKKERKKEKKKKRKRGDHGNQSDTTDKDTSDDDDSGNTDKEILHRLKALKSMQRMKASDLI